MKILNSKQLVWYATGSHYLTKTLKWAETTFRWLATVEVLKTPVHWGKGSRGIWEFSLPSLCVHCDSVSFPLGLPPDLKGGPNQVILLQRLPLAPSSEGFLTSHLPGARNILFWLTHHKSVLIHLVWKPIILSYWHSVTLYKYFGWAPTAKHWLHQVLEKCQWIKEA